MFCRLRVWILLCSGIWGDIGTDDENAQVGCVMFKAAIRRWYKIRHAENPQEKLTRIDDITPGMIGTRNAPTMKTKGAETWGLLLFLETMFRHYGAAVRVDSEWIQFTADDFLETARALIAMCQVMTHAKCNLTRDELDRLLFHWKRFVTVTDGIKELEIPKRHAISHMIIGTPFFGNPKYFACWFDETLNKTLKECCRLRSQQTFESTVLAAMPYLLPRRAARKEFVL